jgi:large subunit ribosomal protein L25
VSETRLTAELREPGRANHTRREGLIPAVVYGHRRSSQALAVGSRDLYQVLSQGINTLIRLQTSAGEDTVMIKHLQRHRLNGRITHVDFLAVALDEMLRTTVPVHLRGEEAVGARGGIVQHQLREVEIEALPTDVPSHLDLDISRLLVGEHLSASDLALPAGVTMITDQDEVVVTVVAPRAAEAETHVAAASEETAAEEPK